LESFIHRKVVVLRETDTAASAAKAMRERRIGCVLVVNHLGSLSGIVTDRDLVNTVLAGEHGPNTRLREFMTRQPKCLPETASIPEAIEGMKDRGVRRIPVVHESKDGVVKCVGLVTLDDLVAAQAVSASDLAQIIKAQIYHGQQEVKNEETSAGDFLKILAGYFYNNEQELENFSRVVFENLFRRLHYSSAIQFMWQLPKEFQIRLSQVAPGPDRTVTAAKMVDEVTEALHIPPEAAAGAVQKLWMVLNRFSDTEALDITMAQLPEELQALFSHPSGPMRVHAG
jgi:CBS domain-containing protein